MEATQARHNDQAAINYATLRYKAEEEIERILEEDFSMAQYYDIFDNKDDLDAITNEMLSNNVLLSPAIAPRIYSICSEIQQKLGFTEQIDFYLQSHTEVNAFSINGFGIVPHIISFTSALIQLMTDDELRYVIGHEIGHLIYKHSKLNNDKFLLLEYIVIITMMDGRLEPEEKKRLMELATMLNISTDALNLIIRRCSENYLAPNKKVMMKEMK